MVCEKCGEINNEGIKFCTKCGSKIQNAPGKGLLKVTGILFIISSIIGIISLVFTFVSTFTLFSGLDLDLDVKDLMDGFQEIGHFIISAMIIGIIGLILTFITGILGIKYCKNTEKAKLLMCLAIIVIVLNIVVLIITSIAYTFSWISLIGFILPICFVIGAKMNLNA